MLTKHVHYVDDVFDHLLATEVDPTGGGTYTQIEHYVLDVSPEIPQAGVPGTALAQPVLGFGESGNLTQRNLVALNPAGVMAVMAQETVNPSGNVVTWIAADHLGSPVDVVSNNGAEDDHIVRSAFGRVAYESNPAATPWAGFGGGHEDPNTGLVNNYHRCYDPATGRWLSEDLLGFASGDTNQSRYGGNGPTVQTDITGLIWPFRSGRRRRWWRRSPNPSPSPRFYPAPSQIEGGGLPFEGSATIGGTIYYGPGAPAPSPSKQPDPTYLPNPNPSYTPGNNGPTR